MQVEPGQQICHTSYRRHKKKKHKNLQEYVDSYPRHLYSSTRERGSYDLKVLFEKLKAADTNDIIGKPK